MKDFRGNEISVGDRIVYAPISSRELVEAEVLEIKTEAGWKNQQTVILAKPLRWSNDTFGWRQGNVVRLTNMHLLLRVDVAN